MAILLNVHDEFYKQPQVTIEGIKRSDYSVLDCNGRFNAIMGNEKVLDKKQHVTSGHRLLEFCSANYLFVTNTGSRHHLRRKTTSISPDGRTKNECDYIIIRSKICSKLKSLPES